MKKYTVGQMAKALGVSSQTLRHYEKMGLIESERNEHNQYREYSMRDNKILMQTNLYRSMGFSLKEIRALIKEYPEEQVQEAFALRIQEVDQEIEQLQLLKNELKEYASAIHQSVLEEGKCWIDPAGHSFYAVLKKGSGFAILDVAMEELVKYQKKGPHIRQGFRIAMDTFQNDQPFDFQYGVFMKKNWAEKNCDAEEIAPYYVQLKGPLAHTYIKCTNLDKSTFDSFFQYIQQQGYQADGDIYGHAVYMNCTEEDLNYFEFLLPVKEC